MPLRCQAGDLAVILRDLPGGEPNIGRTVEVFGPAEVDATGFPCWLIVPVCRDPWVVHHTDLLISLEVIALSDRIEHPDEWMLPIRSEPDEVSAAAEQTAICTVTDANKELT